MNNAYKVVFNKARGALMVANEITSSVQKKGDENGSRGGGFDSSCCWCGRCAEYERDVYC